MGFKRPFENYLQDEDFFIQNRTITSKSETTINHYWYVFFYPELGLNNKAFNKLIYSKDDAKEYRNKMLRNYIKENNDVYKDILEKYLNKYGYILT